MDAKTAMQIGMDIAERHKKAMLDLVSVQPDITVERAAHGAAVYLGSQIMQALCAATTPDAEPPNAY